MTFNAKKCNTMRVSSSSKRISFDYSIHNTVLENVPHTKYLGVTIQSNLKWDVHCKQVAAKATNTLNVLKQNLKSTKEVHEKAYNHLYAHRLNMLPLYGLPGLPETKPELKGYSVGLLTMYIKHTAGTAATLPCYNPSTGKPWNHVGLICICALSTKPITTWPCFP